jgi:hypothetical protein
MPAVKQKRPKQASTACHASSMRGVTASMRGVVVFVMVLLSFKESTPGAYGLKASNAALSISTSIGTSPSTARTCSLERHLMLGPAVEKAIERVERPLGEGLVVHDSDALNARSS